MVAVPKGGKGGSFKLPSAPTEAKILALSSWKGRHWALGTTGPAYLPTPPFHIVATGSEDTGPGGDGGDPQGIQG